MCSLAGIDVLYPMLDDAVVDLSTTLAASTLLEGGKLRGFYKRAFADFLPDAVINKSKHGFGLPFGVWTKNHDGLNRMARDNLASLDQRGILRRGQEASFEWVAKARKYPVTQDGERQEVKRRLMALLFNDEIPEFGDISLIALADACGLFERILTPKTTAKVAPRIAQVRALDLIGGEIARTAAEANREIREAERKTVVAGLAGNVMEWYDFGIYGFFAALIGTVHIDSVIPYILRMDSTEYNGQFGELD